MFNAAGKKYRNQARYPDSELFRLISINDGEAYAELYDRYWEKLFLAACARLESEELAEDIVQDIFLKLYANRRELATVRHPAQYLFTALRYTVYSAYRSQALHHGYVDRFIRSEVYATGTNPVDETYHSKELRLAVQEIADRLPSQCKKVFVYSRQDELSQKEIADKLGISVNTVKKHLTKALRAMKLGLRHYLGLLLLIF